MHAVTAAKPSAQYTHTHTYIQTGQINKYMYRHRRTATRFHFLFFSTDWYGDSLEEEEEGNVLFNNTLNTFYLRLYMASDIWLRTILIVRKETCCRHIGYSYRLTARVLLYAPSHRQDSTYHGLCYTSRGALAYFGNSICLFFTERDVAPW